MYTPPLSSTRIDASYTSPYAHFLTSQTSKLMTTLPSTSLRAVGVEITVLSNPEPNYSLPHGIETYASAGVVSPSIHHGLSLFSLRKRRHMIAAMLTVPISLRNLHHLFELFIGHFSTTIATSLQRIKTSPGYDLPCSKCDRIDRIRRKAQADHHQWAAYSSCNLIFARDEDSTPSLTSASQFSISIFDF